MTYTLFSLPHIPNGLDFRALTTQQARENLEAFVGRIRERVRLLAELVQMELTEWRPDLSDESLASLGDWYARHVEERSPTSAETAKFQKQLEPLGDLASVAVQFTPRTLSIGVDVGIYVGECVRMRCPATAWKLQRREKEPVVSGNGLREDYYPVPKAGNLAFLVVHERMKKAMAGKPVAPPRTLAEVHTATILSLPDRDPRSMLHEIMLKVMEPQVPR